MEPLHTCDWLSILSLTLVGLSCAGKSELCRREIVTRSLIGLTHPSVYSRPELQRVSTEVH
jgi:hypothetical protein